MDEHTRSAEYHGKTTMTEKLRIDLQILLPHLPGEADACVRRLIDDLQGRNGIEQVHLRPGSAGAPAQMCVHYNPDVVPLARIREVVDGKRSKYPPGIDPRRVSQRGKR